MGLSFVEKEFAANTEVFHFVSKVFGSGGWDKVVFGSEEDDGGRGFGGKVVKGGEGLPIGFNAVVSIAGWAVVEDGVKQHECVGLGGDS